MIGKQAKIFLEGEAEQWMRRNAAKLPPKEDPVIDAIQAAQIHPKHVLEVGCADGWRLLELEAKYTSLCYGVDPLITINRRVGDRLVYLRRGTASDLSWAEDGIFDLVIFGFCLYLCDPEDYFKIAAEADRVLQDGGHLIIYDFYLDAGFYPHSRSYKHNPDIVTHKMRFENLWKGHPAYRVLSSHFIGSNNDMTGVVLLKKDMRNAFPVTE